MQVSIREGRTLRCSGGRHGTSEPLVFIQKRFCTLEYYMRRGLSLFKVKSISRVPYGLCHHGPQLKLFVGQSTL